MDCCYAGDNGASCDRASLLQDATDIAGNKTYDIRK